MTATQRLRTPARRCELETRLRLAAPARRRHKVDKRRWRRRREIRTQVGGSLTPLPSLLRAGANLGQIGPSACAGSSRRRSGSSKVPPHRSACAHACCSRGARPGSHLRYVDERLPFSLARTYWLVLCLPNLSRTLDSESVYLDYDCCLCIGSKFSMVQFMARVHTLIGAAGVWRYGAGHWKEIEDDVRLDLKAWARIRKDSLKDRW